MRDRHMDRAVAAVMACILAAPVAAQTASTALQELKIARNGSQASSKGPVQHFTAAVRVDPLLAASPAMSPGLRRTSGTGMGRHRAPR